MARLFIGAGAVVALALALVLGAIQVASMAAYGDLAASPSLPAFLNAVSSANLRAFAGGPYEHAAALAHEKNYAAADRILAGIPEDRRTDDLHGDIASARGDASTAFAWYLKAGDTLRAQSIVDTSFARDPQRALSAQIDLVNALGRQAITGDLMADAWWKLGERQRAVADQHDGGAHGSSDALLSFQRALAQAPNRKSYLLAAGIEALKLGKYDVASRLLTHAVDVGPSSANAYGALALVYAAQKNCGLARTEFTAWRAHATENARPPDEDAQFDAPLRACLGEEPVRPVSAGAVTKTGTEARTTATRATTAAGSSAAESSAAGSSATGSSVTDIPTDAPSGPRILSVVVSPLVVHSGSNVSGAVRTSADVVKVTASVVGVPPQNVPKLGTGDFGGSGTLPTLPAYVKGIYAVTFTAYDSTGRSTSAAVGVTVP